MSLLRAGLLIAAAAALGGLSGHFLGRLIGVPTLGLVIGGAISGCLILALIVGGLRR